MNSVSRTVCLRGLAMACTINRHQLRKKTLRTAADYLPTSFFTSGRR
nr:MAG TPA: hypothetical protein [Caudoviricetes sp.]DAT79378.1 MAG TPA: hypothetical protein [Caudoviricetes sp.]